MEKEKRNRNALRSRKMLINAFVDLVQDTPPEKITVTSIVNKAGLNRSTFYAHFNRPSDIVNYIEQDIIDNLCNFLDDVPADSLLTNPKPLMDKIADFVTERKDFYCMIINARGAGDFLEKLKDVVTERMLEDKVTLAKIKKEESIVINLRFFAGGYISLYKDWFRGRIETDPHEFSDVVAKTIVGGVRACL